VLWLSRITRKKITAEAGAPYVTITCARNNAGGALIAATREEVGALNSGQEWILSGSSG